MREIKFRAWLEAKKEMVNVDVLAISECSWSCPDFGKQGVSLAYQPHIPVMQYTGLKDKHGKKIWEGDIIKWDNEDKPEQVMHSTNWDGRIDQSTAPFMSAWGSTCGRYYKTFMNVFDPARFATVIGNIHENPELFEGGVK